MKEPTANDRPTHGGYPSPEGEDLSACRRRAARTRWDKPAEDQSVTRLPADVPGGEQRLIDEAGARRQRALGGWDDDGNVKNDPMRVAWEAPPAPGSVGAHPHWQLPLADRVAAEFDAGADHVRIDRLDPDEVEYVPSDMLVAIQHQYRPASEFADAFDLSQGIGRIDEFRMPAPLETDDRARRGTLTHPQREPRGVEPGFAFEGKW